VSRQRLPASLLVAACCGGALLYAGDARPTGPTTTPVRQRHQIDLMFSVETGTSSARFRVQYDGSTDEPLGLAVLRVLDGAWAEYSERLGCRPTQPVTVVLQTAAGFQDTTRAPEWAAGWNDGTIRVPVMGLSAPTPALVRVLRHELAHSFVATGAGPRCPIWLHEGIAQWLEGGDPKREDAALAARARQARLPRLESLESSFVTLSKPDAANAYAASLSAVAHIVSLRGEAGLRQLISTLAEGYSIADALPRALQISYADMQSGWERHVRDAGKNGTAGVSQ
jgi:hypothetical protein